MSLTLLASFSAAAGFIVGWFSAFFITLNRR